MGLLELIIALVVVGVLMWLINAYVPMEPGIKRLLNIAVIVILVIWLLMQLGFLDSIANIRIGG